MQKELWEQILALVEQDQADDPNLNIAQPFQITDLGQEYPLDDVERALQLFESMGIIVRVSIQGAPYYRIVTDRDIVRREE